MCKSNEPCPEWDMLKRLARKCIIQNKTKIIRYMDEASNKTI